MNLGFQCGAPCEGVTDHFRAFIQQRTKVDLASIEEAAPEHPVRGQSKSIA